MAKKQKPTNKEEGNQYDKIIKENLQSLVPALFRKILGLTNFRIEDLPEIKLQTTIEREPDFLKMVYDDAHPEGRIIHIEFESNYPKFMKERMLEYLGIIYRKYRKPIEQHLIYLGERPRKIQRTISFKNFHYEFANHNIVEYDYRDFLNSDQPEEVLLSILADQKDIKPEFVIHSIIGRLIQLRGDSQATRKFIRQLEIISKLRKLQEQTSKIIDNMSISFDITTDVRYKQGLSRGKAEGKVEGKAEGKAEGIKLANIIALVKMLDLKMEKALITSLLVGISEKEIIQIQKELLQRKKIIAALKENKLAPKAIAKSLKVSEILILALKKLATEKK